MKLKNIRKLVTEKLKKQQFNADVDLAPYRIRYECSNPCKVGDYCPGHRAEFSYFSTSEIFSITWRVGEDSEYTTSFDAVQFALIQDFMKNLKGS